MKNKLKDWLKDWLCVLPLVGLIFFVKENHRDPYYAQRLVLRTGISQGFWISLIILYFAT